MRFSRTTGMLLVLVLGLATAVPAYAQSSSATLLGTASDESGGALPGVTITATNREEAAELFRIAQCTGKYGPPMSPPRGRRSKQAFIASVRA